MELRISKRWGILAVATIAFFFVVINCWIQKSQWIRKEIGYAQATYETVGIELTDGTVVAQTFKNTVAELNEFTVFIDHCQNQTGRVQLELADLQGNVYCSREVLLEDCDEIVRIPSYPSTSIGKKTLVFTVEAIGTKTEQAPMLLLAAEGKTADLTELSVNGKTVEGQLFINMHHTDYRWSRVLVPMLLAAAVLAFAVVDFEWKDPRLEKAVTVARGIFLALVPMLAWVSFELATQYLYFIQRDIIIWNLLLVYGLFSVCIFCSGRVRGTAMVLQVFLLVFGLANYFVEAFR